MIDPSAIQCFGILGSGTLGWRIGLQAALSGYEVLMFDISQDKLTEAATFQQGLLQRLVKQERYTQSDAEAALGRLSQTSNRDEFCRKATFVSESITENLALKQKVWAEFAGKWQPGTLLTTNTSYLLPSTMAEQSGNPAHFCAFHFHDVFEARVVDVMPHPDTDPAFVEFLMKLGKRLNQIPVHVRNETSGYLFNHMLMAYLGAAGHLLASDKASAQDIDRSWMGNLGTPIGPFGMMDQVGLDTVDHILSGRSDKRSLAFRSVIQPLLEAGKLGIKTGEGFYSYPRPAYKSPEFLS